MDSRLYDHPETSDLPNPALVSSGRRTPLCMSRSMAPAFTVASLGVASSASAIIRPLLPAGKRSSSVPELH